MKVEFHDSFVQKLKHQINYIAKDKPEAARKFKNNILDRCLKLSNHPYKFKKSIYFDDENIRDLPFKGYTIVYKVSPVEKLISVFAFVKHESEIK